MPCSHGYLSPREVYDRHIQTHSHETKMTREEAIKKIYTYFEKESDCFVGAMEALGLLKFDEPKPEPIDPRYILIKGQRILTYEAIEALEKLGYIIGRNVREQS